MSARRGGKRQVAMAVGVLGTCVAAVGIAFASPDGADRAALVPVPALGIEVPARTSELVDLDSAQPVGALASGPRVFRATGAGEQAGSVCVFAADDGRPDVVPMVCDTPTEARRGLDLGQSTPDGGIAGIVVRYGDDGQTYAEAYTVGPSGGSVTLNPGGGEALTLTFPNLRELDKRANADARTHAARLE